MDIVSNEDIDNVLSLPTAFNRAAVKVTYPSGKQAFCTFQEEDTDLTFLNNDIDTSNRVHTNILSTQATVSCSTKRASRCCKLYARSKPMQVSSLTWKVKQLQKTLRAEKMRNHRLHKRLERNSINKNKTLTDFSSAKRLAMFLNQ